MSEPTARGLVEEDKTPSGSNTAQGRRSSRAARWLVIFGLVWLWALSTWVQYVVQWAGFSRLILLAFLPPAFTLLGAACGVIWLLRRGTDSRNQTRQVSCLALALVLGPGTMAGKWTMLHLEELVAAQRLAQLSAAVREFEADHGALPGTVEELVPEHLSAVPRYPDFRAAVGLGILLESDKRTLVASRGWYSCFAGIEEGADWCCSDD